MVCQSWQAFFYPLATNRTVFLGTFRISCCLATSASPHLSLGPQDVGHEGFATRCRDLCLQTLKLIRKRVFDSFAPAVTRRKGDLSSSAGVGLSRHFSHFLLFWLVRHVLIN